MLLSSAKAYGTLADSPVIESAVRDSGGALVVNGKPFDVAPYGIAIAAERKQLAELMQDALKSLMEDGTYQQILDDWGITEGAITDPRILTRKNIPEPTPLYSTQEPTPTPSL